MSKEYFGKQKDFLHRFSNTIRRCKKFAGGLQIALVLGILCQTAFADDLADSPDVSDILSGKKLKKFSIVLNSILTKRGLKKESVCDEKDAVSYRVLREYGSIFIVHEKVSSPPVCLFTNHEEVENFQNSIKISAEILEGFYIELQSAALESLLAARNEALSKNLKITPRNGEEAAQRNYADTLRLWKSRFEPACKYWKNRGKLSAEQIEYLKTLPIKEQVKETLRLEKQGVYFSTNFNYSILQSVAAPGTSQHLSLLAFDVTEYENAEVRRILAKHGWYRTIRNDVPHFTYLGHEENELKNYGLRKIVTKDGEFWLANLS